MDQESTIESILTYNKGFVAQRKGQPFTAPSKPQRHLAVVACMDTRFTTMLATALGLADGDANIIKVAGGQVAEPYGAVMRSLIVAVHMLGVQDVMVIAHTDCGAQHLSAQKLRPLMEQAGIGAQGFAAVEAAGVDLDEWLQGFGDTAQAVRNSVSTIQTHPLMPANLRVRGFIIDTHTGELMTVEQPEEK